MYLELIYYSVQNSFRTSVTASSSKTLPHLPSNALSRSPNLCKSFQIYSFGCQHNKINTHIWHSRLFRSNPGLPYLLPPPGLAPPSCFLIQDLPCPATVLSLRLCSLPGIPFLQPLHTEALPLLPDLPSPKGLRNASNLF